MKENQRLTKKLEEINIAAKTVSNDNRPGEYFIRLSSYNEDRKEFFDFLGQAKYHNQASEIFPHKFDNTILKKIL